MSCTLMVTLYHRDTFCNKSLSFDVKWIIFTSNCYIAFQLIMLIPRRVRALWEHWSHLQFLLSMPLSETIDQLLPVTVRPTILQTPLRLLICCSRFWSVKRVVNGILLLFTPLAFYVSSYSVFNFCIWVRCTGYHSSIMEQPLSFDTLFLVSWSLL